MRKGQNIIKVIGKKKNKWDTSFLKPKKRKYYKTIDNKEEVQIELIPESKTYLKNKELYNKGINPLLMRYTKLVRLKPSN